MDKTYYSSINELTNESIVKENISKAIIFLIPKLKQNK